MTESEQKQVTMHREFFEKSQFAIDNGFYIEAIIMEYAAIESRLESICCILGFPCGKNCPCRKDVRISQRIECLNSFINGNPDHFKASKLDRHLFSDKGILKRWINKRDIIVHGLFKNGPEYDNRLKGNKTLANEGRAIARSLYNEAKRLGRLKKKCPEAFEITRDACQNHKCKGYIAYKAENDRFIDIEGRAT